MMPVSFRASSHFCVSLQRVVVGLVDGEPLGLVDGLALGLLGLALGEKLGLALGLLVGHACTLHAGPSVCSSSGRLLQLSFRERFWFPLPQSFVHPCQPPQPVQVPAGQCLCGR